MAVTTCAVGLLGAAACGDSAGPAEDGGSPPSDALPDGGAGDLAPDGGGPAGLTGTVKDQAGTVVASAHLEVVGSAVATDSDTQGNFTLAGLTPGPVTVKVTRNWFKPLEATTTVAAGPTPYDVVLQEIPLMIAPADRALAGTYNASFDWTKQSLSIVVVPRPTRQDFDDAVYFHNPALYRDTSKEPPLTPSPQPQIVGGEAHGFTFPLKSGAHLGEEALEIGSIVDTIKETPLGATEPTSFMMWTPLINWLSEGEAAKSADLKAAGVAVRQQNWGGNSLRPQEIEKVYLDAAGALWAKVVFASFVQLGPGINDDDGDGLKEVYAKIGAAYAPKELIDKLKNDYAGTVFTTHGLSKEVSKSLNELYSTTGASVERYIGQPFEVPGVGTISYPFVVLRHSSGQKNVFLVGPAP